MANIPTIDTVKLTAKGLRLLAKVQSGATMYFVRAAIGDGFMQDGQDVADLTEMVHEVPSHQTGTTASSATVDLTKAVVEKDGTVSVRVKIKNGDTAFYMRELGIIAKDPDEGEILYAYINFGDGASAMPAFDGSTYIVRNIQMSFIVSNAANVEANITLAAEVSYDDFMAHKNANVLDHPDGCVTTEKLANSSVTNEKLKDGAVSWLKVDGNIKTKFDELEKEIQKLNSTKKIDLKYTISQGSNGYNIVVKPTVNYNERTQITNTATYPPQSMDKCYVDIGYDYDSDSVWVSSSHTVSGKYPIDRPDNSILAFTISDSSDCGDFEYHRLIQKDDDGKAEIVQ